MLRGERGRMKKFNLSNWENHIWQYSGFCYPKEGVEEFIRLLKNYEHRKVINGKESIQISLEDFNKLTGDKFI